MTRPKGLHIPEVQRSSIRHAKRQAEPAVAYSAFRGEQRHLSGWLIKQCKKHETWAFRPVPMPLVIDEAVIAYGAIKHAYGDDIPCVEQRTIHGYFDGIITSPDGDTVIHRLTADEPMAPMSHDGTVAMIDDFCLQQVYLADRLQSRFIDDEFLFGSALKLMAMTCNMLELRLGLPAEH